MTTMATVTNNIDNDNDNGNDIGNSNDKGINIDNNPCAYISPIAYMVFLVCTHVTRRPCWMAIQYNFFSQNFT